jgi:hypothetical protein
MLIAMIHSKQTAEGYYEQPVHIPIEAIRSSGDPRGFIDQQVQRHLEVCVVSTGIPLRVGVWNVEFNPELLAEFDLPKGFVI